MSAHLYDFLLYGRAAEVLHEYMGSEGSFIVYRLIRPKHSQVADGKWSTARELAGRYGYNVVDKVWKCVGGACNAFICCRSWMIISYSAPTGPNLGR